MHDFGLYIVMTSPELGYRDFTKLCVEMEVPFIQLRDKEMPFVSQLDLAKDLVAVCRGSKTRLIVNDSIELCRLSDADGLHLGPADAPWTEARRILPPGKILGVSTHSIEAALAMISQIRHPGEVKAPDYMSFGPIYPTVAKKIPDAPLGTEKLRYVIAQTPIPLVAIGGIFPHNIPEVLASGACNLCFIRHFASSATADELRTKIKQFYTILKETQS
ncbi:MAG: thiamine phosphate synthase [Candidatus Cloacimonadales bacterium]|jgi:thiamine-phosphate pyrophosphorylase|nr:thiamine phosphate synthase [Candidatus Cloacimonadota bacterium]MDY0381852.1 thiamine phosphate synthase [Candidatus Cloacimonadaceae bacterium]HCM16149.1 thiamine phosphate synthase [Candidatus Cloacimonas sp.]MCB5257194.1 thiamine phosphate synthase [Candidatus Cloacimonadota bacterium]MCB5263830.1 thiamine phosphate synthase [Candidatus Cloacimonadota bacterium]